MQAEGCCPLNRAVQTGRPWAPMEENTLADSIAVGVPRNPDKALRAIRESDGVAVNVSDGEILEAMRLLGPHPGGVRRARGGGPAPPGVKKAVELGLIPAGSTVVSIVTGNGLKDVQSGIQAARGAPCGSLLTWMPCLPPSPPRTSGPENQQRKETTLMNDRSAKIGVWAYLLFTLASFALALYLLLAEGGYRYNVSLVALPVWMGYTAFNTIKSVSDLIGAQNRTANFTRMLARWEDTFENRGKALALFTFMTLVVGLIKLAVPILLLQLGQAFA